ncbi:unnamed protein product [Amoebophrya sp. A25]|nr:unnamed protein product [Amoebophrya sp. A25]|eukprot:GSA25T00010141001.1
MSHHASSSSTGGPNKGPLNGAMGVEKSMSFVDNDDFKELFLMFDKDAGGSIDEQEFNQMLRVLGINVKFPKDPGEAITFPELCALLTHLSRPLTRDEEIVEAFKFFAPTGTHITPASLVDAYRILGDETLSARDAAALLGVRPDIELMTQEEIEAAKEHGSGFGEVSTGMAFNEFEYRIMSTMTAEEEEGLVKSPKRDKKSGSPSNPRKASIGG